MGQERSDKERADDLEEKLFKKLREIAKGDEPVAIVAKYLVLTKVILSMVMSDSSYKEILDELECGD